MTDQVTLKQAVEQRGPFAVWDVMTEDEQRSAAAALWTNADREGRLIIEMALAKELKFRPQSVRRLGADQVVPRLVRLVKDLPENVLFQFLFHLHMAERRELLAKFLDAVGLPHDNGVLDLDEDTEAPATDVVGAAAAKLVADDEHQAVVYLATLKVADSDFWTGVDGVLEGYAEDGSAIEKKKAKPKAKPKTKPKAKAKPKKTAAKKTKE